MQQIRSLIWKEWREARAFLWIGLGVFIGLPVIGGLEWMSHSHRFEINTELWVIPFAGVLAVFAAVGASCRDFGGRLEEFWHAQPVAVSKRLLVKYLVGLAVILTVGILPLVIEWAVNKQEDPAVLKYAAWLPFTWTALYSLGFAAGCLVRRTAHAGMLALSAMLLVYFLPIVLPPLEWLNVETIIGTAVPTVSSQSQQLKFSAGMLGLALASLAVGMVAVRRRWHVESGRKMMYGAVSFAILIVFASAAFRLGTNLPILQQIDLPKDENGGFVRVEGQRGFLMTFSGDWHTYGWKCRPIEIGSEQVRLGESRNAAPFQFGWVSVVWDPNNSDLAYFASEYTDTAKDVCYLFHRALGNETETTPRKLWEYDQRVKSLWRRVALCIWQNHLYVMGTRLVRIDLNHSDEEPEVLAAPFPYSFDEQLFGPDRVVLQLPPVPQLPPRQRLEAVLNQPDYSLENDMLCLAQGESLLAYRLTYLTEVTATFEKTGQYKESLLERIFGTFRYSGIKLQNGLLYVNGAAGALFNPHVTVFDARAGQPFRPIGHFAAPGSTMVVCPLPDGRSLIAGSKLWVVGPAPLRRPS